MEWLKTIHIPLVNGFRLKLGYFLTFNLLISQKAKIVW